MTIKPPLRIFCDFDGTISSRDVGAEIFNTLSKGHNRAVVELWMENKISTRECLWQESAFVQSSIEEMLELAFEIEIRSGFKEFFKYLKNSNIPFHIVSDGLGFYIEPYLQRHNISNVDIHTNETISRNGKIYPFFPNYHKGCGRCGTCKGERIDSLAGEGEYKIFIGDGLSDKCALGKADLIFARKDLAELCRQKSVDYVPFEDFLVIQNYIEKKLI